MDLEKSKFYTPEIEEFHVGFEYEFRTLKGWDKKVMSWNDYPSFAGDYIGEAIQEGDGIRVKYLDDHDIQICLEGDKHFAFVCHAEGGNDFFKNNNGDSFIHNIHSGKCVITLWDSVRKEDYTAFVGIITNKSELKQVFKQIGI